MVVMAVGRFDTEATPAASYQALLAHEPFDALVVQAMTAPSEFPSHARAAVSSLELGKDASKKCFFMEPVLVSFEIGLAFKPGVIGATRQLQSATELSDGIKWREVLHSLAALGRSERMAIVFFKISH